MQYVFSMTSRMVTIALGCALLLCVLLFLLGMQIGARLTGQTPAQATSQPIAGASWSAAVVPGRAPAGASTPAGATAYPNGATNASNPADATDTSDASRMSDVSDETVAQPSPVVPVVIPAAAANAADSGS
ncbi:hypothetical protein [Paraburkholderia rhizosphaerae]|uniref:Uncharacterized protein n=1 Tax=Paraburkholderia rhizosphaerae TaxID=480658 RepID=A0A4V3HF46_9BURK|nr:hypothetical protein [Paraburkholderia rhizosphaerae]TDY51461.1 hypothetical protein BX592_10729 [Paraburkholderia rhizosphaerae]